MVRYCWLRLLLLLLLIVGCASAGNDNPAAASSDRFRGTVHMVQDVPEFWKGAAEGWLHFNDIMLENTKFDSATIELTGSTKVFRIEGKERKPVPLGSIKAQMQVEVKLTGKMEKRRITEGDTKAGGPVKLDVPRNVLTARAEEVLILEEK